MDRWNGKARAFTAMKLTSNSQIVIETSRLWEAVFSISRSLFIYCLSLILLLFSFKLINYNSFRKFLNLCVFGNFGFLIANNIRGSL
jgi:uncharacterized membrane protein (DUF485 family)